MGQNALFDAIQQTALGKQLMNNNIKNIEKHSDKGITFYVPENMLKPIDKDGLLKL